MTDKLLEHQKAFLLLQLLLAKDRKLSRAEANKKLVARNSLDLNARSANQLRDVLVQQDYMKKAREKTTGHAKADFYELTDRGLALLGELEQYPSFRLWITGREINTLVSRLLELPGAWKRPEASPQPAPPPPNLDEAILTEFEELRRERHSHRGLVPIHEVRQRIAAKLGPEAARHDVFDAQVQRLREQHRLRIVPISDLRDATAEQLNESIPGVNETLFYLEAAHEQPVLH